MFCEKNVSGEIYFLPNETEYPVVIGIEPAVQKTSKTKVVSKSPQDALEPEIFKCIEYFLPGSNDPKLFDCAEGSAVPLKVLMNEKVPIETAVTPLTPGDPEAPGAPVAPVLPAGPGGPAGPALPDAPAGPVDPAGPVAPIAPAVPETVEVFVIVLPSDPATPGVPVLPSVPAAPRNEIGSGQELFFLGP